MLALRYYFVIGLFVLLTMILAATLLSLGVESDFLQRQGDARTHRKVVIKTARGLIYDRYGEPLTKNQTVYNIFLAPMNPHSDEDLLTIARILDLSFEKLTDRINRFSKLKKRLMAIKREVSSEELKNIPSYVSHFIALEQQKRIYPYGSVLAHVIGFVNLDGRGQKGIELAYDKSLTGESGEIIVLKDGRGNTIKELETLKHQKLGIDIDLSIDLRLQLLAYHELSSVTSQADIQSGSLVAIDPASGEILAMVNLPSYDPNDQTQLITDTMRNRVITDVHKPGHLIAPFVLLTALESGKYTSQSRVDTGPGYFKIGRLSIKDFSNLREISFLQVLSQMSNVGVAKISLSLLNTGLYANLKKLGFGKTTDIGIPGESIGHLEDPALALQSMETNMAQVTLAKGHGLTASVLQLASAYCVLANRGIHIPITLKKREVKARPGKQLFDTKVTKRILEIMRGSLDSAMGKTLMPGYEIAGHGSVVKVVKENKGDENRHNIYFAGVVPYDNHRMVVVVSLQNVYLSEVLTYQTAAMVFASFATSAMYSIGQRSSLE